MKLTSFELTASQCLKNLRNNIPTKSDDTILHRRVSSKSMLSVCGYRKIFGICEGFSRIFWSSLVYATGVFSHSLYTVPAFVFVLLPFEHFAETQYRAL